MERDPYYIYIMTNTYDSVFYTGVTNNLKRRVGEHKEKLNPNCFTAIYKLHKLVYYEKFIYVNDAIAREKQIKGGSRRKKIELIEKCNKNWIDLFPEL